MSDLYGLIGGKLGHSLSPMIHEEIFKELNIKGNYHLFEVDNRDLKNAIYGIKALKIKGINVTIPHKIKIIQYLDEISMEAKKIGAINTIYIKGKEALGYNTDYYGFEMMLNKYKVDVRGKRALILGTGGASKAVSQYFMDNDISNIILVSRNIYEAKRKYDDLEIISYDKIKYLKDQDIIINCTPIGMYPNTNISPIDKEDMKKFDVAIDLIYNPDKTLFLKYAREAKVKGINGLYMLVGQAIKAQEIWNGIKISNDKCDRIYKTIYRKIHKDLF